MIRRNARLRREYLYRKSLEGKEKTTYEKKQKMKSAIAGQCTSAHLSIAVRYRPSALCHRL